MKKWLDKYKIPEAQNGIEGTMGGLTDKGFNYNPAWGGAWKNGGNLQPPMAGVQQSLPMYAAGGNLPGSVGFTYARTQGIPSEGPYAKKTMPSAQNGQEMSFYQHGLDWTPRNISRNGSEILMAQGGEDLPYWMKRSSDVSQRGNQNLKTEIATQKTKEKKAQQQVENLVKYKGYTEKDARTAVKYKTKAGQRDIKEIERVETRAAAHPDFQPGIGWGQMQALSEAGDLRSRLLRGSNLLTNTGNPVTDLVAGIVTAPGRSFANITTDAQNRYLNPILAGNVGEGITNFGLDLFDVAPTAVIGAASKLPQAVKRIKPTFVSSSVDNVVNTSRNLEDLKYAKDFAKQYGYDLPENLERISQSDELTNRTIRGMMDRHNTFVRGVSTNWKFLEQKNPEILRHLEGKGFNLSTEEGSRAAAEYMSTHIPISTGYGRADLNTKVFNKGMDGLYTSNSIPTAEGYTYGDGFIVKVKKPTDFSFSNRKDWINKNNPEYYNDFLPSGRIFNTSELNKMTPVDADRLLNEARINNDEHQRMLKYFDQSKNKKKELMNKYQINQSSNIGDSKFDDYLNELETERENIAKSIFDEDYSKKILRTERSPEFDANSRFTFNKRINEFIKSKGKDPMSSLPGTPEGEKIYQDIINIQKNPLNANQNVLDYIKSNYPDYDLQNRYAHYIHIGTPGQKVLNPVKTWRITPDIWKNKSRAHTNVYTKKLSTLEEGGVVKDNNGYWNPDNWGNVVEIDSPNITMQGVNQDLIGISDEGDVQYMEPGKDYKFKGKKVKEYPVAKYGVNQQDEKTAQHLDQLLNFTNKPKAKSGGWLDKY
jgi:hypothetical protein